MSGHIYIFYDLVKVRLIIQLAMATLFSISYFVLAVIVQHICCKSLDNPKHLLSRLLFPYDLQNVSLQSSGEADRTSDCSLDPDSYTDWPEWPPIMTDQQGDFLLPTG